jgi:DNA-binding transcriptional regulator GbsR (MarR family)
MEAAAPVAELSPDEREFVDRMGLWMEKFGGPRMSGLIYGWLLICDPPHQSITEIATTLGVSKASVSTVIRPLQEAGMVERVPVANRQHHYRLSPGGFTHIMRTQLAYVQASRATIDFGLSVVGSDPAKRERLEDVSEFFRFMEGETEAFMQRWEGFRQRKPGKRSQR